jgi:hypothetical protein
LPTQHGRVCARKHSGVSRRSRMTVPPSQAFNE